AEAFYAGKMTEKKNGAVVRDITTTLTETAQMYVVMPVPASIKAAIKPTNQPPNWTLIRWLDRRLDACRNRHHDIHLCRFRQRRRNVADDGAVLLLRHLARVKRLGRVERIVP